MRCPKCNYFFSEEKKVCPRCGNDMGKVIEKLGFFPQSRKEPFLSPEDFVEVSSTSTEPEVSTPSQKPEEKERREIEIPLEIEES